MSYRVDPNKAESIILCARPKYVFINGVPKSGKTSFASRFKQHGFNVVPFGKNAKNACNRGPTIVEGFVKDYSELEDFFPGNFIYVWIYPNDPKAFLARGGIIADLSENKKIYAEHLDATDSRMLTVLN